ncbi:MAG: hypothetical protein GY816_21145 [Cytophagales bacterium]|nr:hypothetical protein [Cytophagales bacterium]
MRKFEELYGCKISKLVLVFNTWQEIYQEFIDRLTPEIPVLLFHGLSDQVFAANTLSQNGVEGCTVIIIDDCLRQLMGKEFQTQMTQLATVDVHHKRICLFLVLQLATFKNSLNHVWSNAQYIYIPLFSTNVATNLCQNLKVMRKKA